MRFEVAQWLIAVGCCAFHYVLSTWLSNRLVLRGVYVLNVLKLKGKIAENGMNMTGLAKAIGMNKDTLYRRISNEGRI